MVAARSTMARNGLLQIWEPGWDGGCGLKQAGGGDGDLQVETATWSVVVMVLTVAGF
jgi:deoxycytidine triphosphate deaminase